MVLHTEDSDIHVELTEELEDLARMIDDDEKMMEILKNFAGINLYFPQKISKAIEHEKIWNDYRDLCSRPNIPKMRVLTILEERYGISKRWIHEIVTRHQLAT
jgi:hypothetical protein